jgi:hypothetical protein
MVGVRIIRRDAGPSAVSLVRGYFFVRRKELDKPYPMPGSGTSSLGDNEPLPSQSPRGPKPEHDWKRLTALEIAQRAIAGEREPTVNEMLQWSSDKWDAWEPDERNMRKLLERLRVLF